MTEESFLRYRLDVVRTLPEGPYKVALVESIRAKMRRLGQTGRGYSDQFTSAQM